MALRSVLGARSDGVFGFWVAKPGKAVTPSAPADDYVISTSHGVGLRQIVAQGGVTIPGSGSVTINWPFDLGFIPQTFIQPGQFAGVADNPIDVGMFAFGFAMPQASVTRTGMTFSNPGTNAVYCAYFVINRPVTSGSSAGPVSGPNQRVFVGDDGGVWKFRVSQDGYDARNCAADKLLFCEAFGVLRLHKATAGHGVGANTLSFDRTFAVPPMVCWGNRNKLINLTTEPYTIVQRLADNFFRVSTGGSAFWLAIGTAGMTKSWRGTGNIYWTNIPWPCWAALETT